jgi:predicted transcriptional regulator
MNVTLSLEDDLVKKVRKIAVDRDTTLTAMIRQYLEQVATGDDSTGRRRRQREALERTFAKYRFKIGKRTWRRSDLYERS